MDLFSSTLSNLLPCDGVVIHHGEAIAAPEADRLFAALNKDVPWQHDEVILYGRRITTARRMAWYGDKGAAYTYSGISREPLAWTPDLLALKIIVEQVSGAVFNSCLLNAYADGTQGMGWHSDDEKTLGRDPTIASVSLGAARRFCFKHRVTGLKTETLLDHGSLLVMSGATQHHWLHSLPKAARVTQARINLTFRLIRDLAK